MTPYPVTHAVDADGVGWIVFDDPAARANVFSAPVLAALRHALDALAASPPRALVVTSAKDRIFIAGADLHWMERLPDPATAAAVSREGQALFQRLADFPAPVVAAIHGAAAGGGLELALACHWRIASDAAATQIGLPEVGIGCIPGWGGTARLPRLIGAQAALDHLLKARLLPAPEALAAGMVDEIVPAAGLKARARAAALRLAGGPPPPRTPPPLAPPAWFEELRRTTTARTHRHVPAATAVIDLVAAGADQPLAEALARESESFGRIMTGAVCRNLIHGFFVRDAAKKRSLAPWFPADTPAAAVRKVGVVGAGVMGSGIAQWCAARGLQVVMRDVQPAFVERGLGVIRGLFDEAVKRRLMSANDATSGLARVATTTAWDGFSDCDLVIEAIVENVAAKQQLFSELAAVVRPDTLLASNTSALPIEELAGHVPHPGRTLGLHFFNPVSRMALVELIVGRHTTAAAAAAGLAFAKALGKSPVICRSSPGFLVTRVLFFYLNEACRLWEEGVPTEVIDAALHAWGWPMGPMRLIDEVGVDVTDFIFGEMEHYFPGRFARTAICSRLLAAGLKGRKNGASSGFYAYEGRKEVLNPIVAGLTEPGRAPEKAPAIVDRLMGVMIAEAQRCLDEGVVKAPDDVDFALLAGAGFPGFRGGLMRYAATKAQQA
ncbi:MAG: enoyl-CoA hydratase/isomerase family protein [Opitutaceae bacterium]|nr:enoyl-CoA hydratase/isomerase family protein [Opitutaceae bacterium]